MRNFRERRSAGRGQSGLMLTRIILCLLVSQSPARRSRTELGIPVVIQTEWLPCLKAVPPSNLRT